MKNLVPIFIFVSISFIFAQGFQLRQSRLIDTFIISGPFIINETNQIVFKFEARDYSYKSKNFYFQTILWPLEKKWQNFYGTEKRYSLPKGSNFYIFKVRAINDKGLYDPTPAVYYFFNKTSQFYNDVSIYPSWDGLSLTLVNNTDKEINITNWQIKTSKIIYMIPKGIKDFHFDFSKRKEENIVLPPYGRAVIKAVYSSATSAPQGLTEISLSPFGVNFLGNKCFFYLDKTYSSNYCDSLGYSKEEILNMVLRGQISRECANLIQYSDCDGDFLLQKSRSLKDITCQALIENHYNYNSCYLRNRDKKDFFGQEWRIYFDPRNELERINRQPLSRIFYERFDQIKLYDEKGFLVNQYNIY